MLQYPDKVVILYEYSLALGGVNLYQATEVP